ncbi:MAG: hypothetical protein ACOX6Y_06165 [Christensenellales bacterium]
MNKKYKDIDTIFKEAGDFKEKNKLGVQNVDDLKKDEKFFSHTYNKKEMLDINNLADLWDQYKSQKKKYNDIKRKHIFLLTQEKTNKANMIKAEILNPADPPDERIVKIVVNPKWPEVLRRKTRVLSIFHEVGHYIGERKRKNINNDIEKDREAYFLDLVLSEYLNQLYRYILSEVTGISEEQMPRELEDSPYVSPEVRGFAWELRKFLAKEERYNQLIESFREDIKDAKEEETYDGCESRVDNCSKKKKEALECGYFEELKKLTNKVINTKVLNNSGNANSVYKQFEKAMYEFMEKEFSYQGECYLKNAINNLHNAFRPKSNGEACYLIDVKALLLQEIAADYFMLFVTEAKKDEYVSLIIDASIEYLKSTKIIPIDNLVLFMNNGVILPRMIAVYISKFGKKDEEGHLVSEGLKINKFGWWGFSKKSRVRKAGLALFNAVLYEYNQFRTYEKEDYAIQRLFNPITDAVEYAKTINKQYNLLQDIAKKKEECLQAKIMDEVKSMRDYYSAKWYI